MNRVVSIDPARVEGVAAALEEPSPPGDVRTEAAQMLRALRRALNAAEARERTLLAAADIERRALVENAELKRRLALRKAGSGAAETAARGPFAAAMAKALAECETMPEARKREFDAARRASRSR